MSELNEKLQEIKRQKDTYILPENLKKDVTAFGVTGTYEGSGGSGDVKLFETVEKMQLDTSPNEGDLAVVYREEIQPIDENSEFDSCIFPNTVVLDEAFTESISGRFRAVDHSVMFDGNIGMSSSNFRFNGFGNKMVRVEYTSQDGITYTRTDGGEELQEFGVVIKYEPMEPWNNIIGNFMKIGGNYFDGMYEYKSNEYVMTKNQLNATSDYVYKQSFYGKNGVESGTLGTPDNSFADTNAEVYNKIQNQYENMEPRVLTNSDKNIDENIYFIPVKKDGTPLLDTSSVTNMHAMFQDCSKLTTIPLLNTSKVTDMHYMFNHCENLTTISLLDTSRVIDISWMFNGCTNLTTIPELDTSSATNMNTMFASCTNLTTIPLLDTSNATDMHAMFANCSNLTTIPELKTSKVTNMESMFFNCTNLTAIPLLDTSNVTNMQWMFDGCTNLTVIPLLNTSKVTSMHYMIANCSNLTTIPQLDTSSVTDMGLMFNGCTNLNNESLNNILAMCANAVKITSNKTLKYIGLTEEQATICQGLSNYSAFTTAGWTTGY